VHLEQVLSILSDKGPHPAVTENLLAMLGNTSPGAHLLGVADVNPIQAPSLQSPSLQSTTQFQNQRYPSSPWVNIHFTFSLFSTVYFVTLNIGFNEIL
jgi:hypothetical protein